LLHFGMTIVGLPHSHQGQMTLDEIVGGAPYVATTIAGRQAGGQAGATTAERDRAGRCVSPWRTDRADREQAVRLTVDAWCAAGR
jgi:hypothetical protein